MSQMAYGPFSVHMGCHVLIDPTVDGEASVWLYHVHGTGSDDQPLPVAFFLAEDDAQDLAERWNAELDA